MCRFSSGSMAARCRVAAMIGVAFVTAGASGLQSPYPGPGPTSAHRVIEAENYDSGGPGVSYNDATAGNTGGSAYRADDVDIQQYQGGTTNTPPVYTVNQLADGEWLEYTIDIPQSANYRIGARIKNPATGVVQAFLQVQIGADGGPYEFDSGPVGMPTGTNWRTGQFSASAALTAGTRVLRLTVVTQGTLEEIDQLYLVLLTGTQEAYPGGTPHAIPGVIEAADYDIGGPGISYNDTTNWQAGTATGYRNVRATDVDAFTLKTEGNVVGFTASGEWMEYTVDVAEAGLYEVLVRYSVTAADKTFDITVQPDGTSILGGAQSFPWGVGGINDYSSAPFLANLAAGVQVLRFTMPAAGNLNVCRFEFRKVNGDPPTDDIGFWRFDIDGKNADDTADVVRDLSAHGHHGLAVGGPKYLSDIPGIKPGNTSTTITPNHTHHGGYPNRLSLDFVRNSGHFVAVDDTDGSLSLGDSSFTIEAWVKPYSVPTGTSDPAERQWLVCKKAAGTVDSEIDYGLLTAGADLAAAPTFSNYNADPLNPYVPTGGEFVLVFGTGSGVQTVASRLKMTSAMSWRRIQVSYDAVKKEVIFLLNGEDGDLVKGVQRSGAAVNSGKLYIGAHVDSAGTVDQFLDATIDELRITPRPLAGSPTKTALFGTSWYWENDGSSTPDGMYTVLGRRPFAMNRGQMYDWNRCFWDVVSVPGEPGNLALRLVDADEAIPTGKNQSNCMKWDNADGDAGDNAMPQRTSDGVTLQMRFKLPRFVANRDNIFDSWEGRAKFAWFVSDLVSFAPYTKNAEFGWNVSYADEAARTGIALWAKEKNIDDNNDGVYDRRWQSGDLNDGQWHTLHAVGYADGTDLRRKTWLDGVLVEDFVMKYYVDPGSINFGFNDHYDPNMWTAEAWFDYIRVSGEGAWDPQGRPITPMPCTRPQPTDADGDGDVDLTDFGAFQGCFNGPNRPWPAEADPGVCHCFDLDGDQDVDLADFGSFQGCFNGPNRPAACGG